MVSTLNPVPTSIECRKKGKTFTWARSLSLSCLCRLVLPKACTSLRTQPSPLAMCMPCIDALTRCWHIFSQPACWRLATHLQVTLSYQLQSLCQSRPLILGSPRLSGLFQLSRASGRAIVCTPCMWLHADDATAAHLPVLHDACHPVQESNSISACQAQRQVTPGRAHRDRIRAVWERHRAALCVGL